MGSSRRLEAIPSLGHGWEILLIGEVRSLAPEAAVLLSPLFLEMERCRKRTRVVLAIDPGHLTAELGRQLARPPPQRA